MNGRPLGAATIIAMFTIVACSDPPLASRTTVAATNATVTGVVVERLNAPPYNYLRLKTDSGFVWVAVPMATFVNGVSVTVKQGAVLENFVIPKLRKKLDVVVFGTIDGG